MDPPPLVESRRYASTLWYVQCGQPATLVSFVEVDKTVIKEEIMVHLHKTKRVNNNLKIDRVTIRDFLLKVKMWRGKNSICFVEDSMHKINVSPKDNVMIVVVVGETILRRSVVNRIRLLVCLTQWLNHNNKRRTI